MKNIVSFRFITNILVAALFGLSLTGCSTETNDAPTMQTVSTPLPSIDDKEGDVFPFNSNNPYDYAGTLHNDILSDYYSSVPVPANTDDIAGQLLSIANTKPGYTALKEPFIFYPHSLKVQHMLDHPDTSVADVIADTGISSEAKSSLNGFVVTALILAQKDIEYKALYDFVCQYETKIIADMLLSSHDKEVILTTTSITRHSVYMAKKRPKKNTDPDWTIFIANIAGGIYGADHGCTAGIMIPLVAGIAQNQ